MYTPPKHYRASAALAGRPKSTAQMSGRSRRGSSGDEADKISFLGANYGTISTQARPLFEIGWMFMLIAVIIGTVAIYAKAPWLTTSFLVITVPALIGIRLWSKEKSIGLPIFPIFLVQQAIVYSIPVFAYADGIEDRYQEIFLLSASLSGIFYLCLYWGWKFATKNTTPKKSKLNLSLGEGKDADSKILNLAFALLAASLFYHILWRTGIWEAYIANSIGGLASIIRTFSAAAAMLGALLGGIVIGKLPSAGRKFLFWFLVISLAVISLIDVLLSDASRVVIAAVVGMALGKGRPPWMILIVTFAIVGFLNPGKTAIREQYWQRGTNSTELSFAQLPGFFGDWVSISASIMVGSSEEDEGPKQEGHSVFKRIDNIQNTLFVVDAIQRVGRPILKGKTYTLIPQLFIPRAVWKGKPRAHLGQAHLNVDFGRQRNMEATHKVYIAWGLLPEAIGNFGVWPGPIILGLIMGMLIGWLERISLKKRILSVEGLTLGGLLLITAGSYEMVASVLLTSTFQFLVAVGAAGFGLYVIFQGKEVDARDERVLERAGSNISGKKGPASTVPLKSGQLRGPRSSQPVAPRAAVATEGLSHDMNHPPVHTTPIQTAVQWSSLIPSNITPPGSAISLLALS